MRRLTFLCLPLLILCLFATLPINTPVHAYQPSPPSPPKILRTMGNTVTPLIATYNWTDFWRIFQKHSAWDLEVNAGAGWQSVKEDLNILRNYPNNWTCKISLIFNASTTGDYRLTFAIDLRVQNYTYKEADHRYVITYQNHTVYFDWTDLVAINGLTFTHGITEVGGIDVFWFRLRRNNVPYGAYLELDPTFGYETKGSGSYASDCEFIGSWYNLTEDGKVTTISVYVKNEGTSNRWMKVGVFDMEPSWYVDDCLTSEDYEVAGSYDGWVNVTLTTQPVLTGAQPYFLALFSVSDLRYYYDVATNKATLESIDATEFCQNNKHLLCTIDRNYTVYASYSLVTPNIGNFESSQANVYAANYFLVNATINDSSGINDFVNATLELDGGIILKWDNATNTFSEHADPSGYCTLGSSSRTNLNSTAHRLSWNLSLASNYPTGYVDVVLANTKVFDNAGNSASNGKSNLFTFEGAEAGDPAKISGGPSLPSQPMERPEHYIYEGPPEYYGPPRPTGPTIDIGLTAMVMFIGGMGVIGYVSQKIHRSNSRANLLKQRSTHKRGHPRKAKLKRASPRDYEKKAKTKR